MPTKTLERLFYVIAFALLVFAVIALAPTALHLGAAWLILLLLLATAFVAVFVVLHRVAG